MSKTILTDVEGWTPLIDEIVKRHGIVTAAVFGRVWRYCQMPDGICYASQETIATELNISRKTVNEHIEILIENGYLRDLTPDVKNKPHSYADTGKIKLKSTLSTVTESNSGVTESYSECNDGLQQGVTESYSKKVLIRDKTRNNTRLKDSASAAGKTRQPPDERLNNPAIQAYKNVARMHVPIAWRDEVIHTVNDVTLWTDIVRGWIGHGWNKQNVSGMLDAYRAGGIRNGNGNGHKPAAPTKQDIAAAAFAAIEERRRNGNG